MIAKFVKLAKISLFWAVCGFFMGGVVGAFYTKESLSRSGVVAMVTPKGELILENGDLLIFTKIRVFAKKIGVRDEINKNLKGKKISYTFSILSEDFIIDELYEIDDESKKITDLHELLLSRGLALPNGKSLLASPTLKTRYLHSCWRAYRFHLGIWKQQRIPNRF